VGVRKFLWMSPLVEVTLLTSITNEFQFVHHGYCCNMIHRYSIS
jgi:hypothetical protein